MKIAIDWKPQKSLLDLAAQEKPTWSKAKLNACIKKFGKHHLDKGTDFSTDAALEISWRGWIGRERDEGGKRKVSSCVPSLLCCMPGCGKPWYFKTNGRRYCRDHFEL